MINQAQMSARMDKKQSIRAQLIRRRFRSIEELLPSVYASLVDFLAARQLLRFGPFDAAPCVDATIEDLSTEKIRLFLGIASRARGFPFSEGMPPTQVLEHLNLLKDGGPTNAAILLFGKEPQRFLILCSPRSIWPWARGKAAPRHRWLMRCRRRWCERRS